MSAMLNTVDIYFQENVPVAEDASSQSVSVNAPVRKEGQAPPDTDAQTVRLSPPVTTAVTTGVPSAPASKNIALDAPLPGSAELADRASRSMAAVMQRSMETRRESSSRRKKPGRGGVLGAVRDGFQSLFGGRK